MPLALEQLSLCAATTEPAPQLRKSAQAQFTRHDERSCCSEKPVDSEGEWLPLTTTRKSPSAAMMNQCDRNSTNQSKELNNRDLVKTEQVQGLKFAKKRPEEYTYPTPNWLALGVG